MLPADAGALGFQIVLGAARQFLGAVCEQHILAPQVECAVLGQRGAAAAACLRGAHRVRVTGQVLDRLALAVQGVGDDAQVVGDGEATVGEHRGALLAGLQAHVRLGVGTVGRVRRVEVARLAGVAARAHGQVLATHGDVAPRGVAVQAIIGVARAVRVTAELAILAQHLVFLGALGADAEPAAVEGLAEGGAVGALLAVAFAVLADVGTGLAAIEVPAGNDVDHTGDGVRAVQRGLATRQHFDALDDVDRNAADVVEGTWCSPGSGRTCRLLRRPG
ncbi:hypothetical protein G6F35_012877 [Rhizopus arrhizus]|nr:hypothetical protein G6F35_012877 [Rhizopus arrhizus]